jgi:hypothetical protein
MLHKHVILRNLSIKYSTSTTLQNARVFDETVSPRDCAQLEIIEIIGYIHVAAASWIIMRTN